MANKDTRFFFSATDTAKILDISVQAFRAWDLEPSGTRGLVKLYDIRVVIRHRLARESKDALALTTERARLAKEQADKTAMENEERRGHLVAVNAVAERWEKICGTIRQRFLGVPAKIARRILTCRTAPEAKAIIESEIYEILSELSAGRGRGSRSRSVDASAKADRKRVGRRTPEAKPGKQRRTRAVANR